MHRFKFGTLLNFVPEESIEHDFIKVLMIHTDNQIVTELSWQSIRIRRLWVQTPLRAIFDEIYFVVRNFKSVR